MPTMLTTKLAVASAKTHVVQVKDTVHTKLTRPERDLTIETAHEVALVWNVAFDLNVEVETMLDEMYREFGDMLRSPRP